MAFLTRAEMEAVIRGGGTVKYNGRGYGDEKYPLGVHITRIEDLPSEAELAAGDPVKEKQVGDDLRARIAELEGQLSDLQSKDAATTAELDSLKVAELRERAKAAGIDGAGDMKKDELVAALSDAQGNAPAGNAPASA